MSAAEPPSRISPSQAPSAASPAEPPGSSGRAAPRPSAGDGAPEGPRWSWPIALLLALRPRQWSKNLLLYAGFLFTLNQVWKPLQPSMWAALLRSSLGVLLFCAVSSGVYLLNDLRDLEQDRAHPVKRHRPLARRLLPEWLAVLAAFVLLIGGVGGSWALRPLLGGVAALYIAMQVAYTLKLKHLVILDVFVIALGFVLRAISGAIVLYAHISPWLYIVTFLAALFLGLCKRRHELVLLNADAVHHRRILREYSIELLDQMISIVTASTIMAYSLYTFKAEGLPENNLMMLTIPYVLYGMFRYLYLVHKRNSGGSPEEVLLRDRPLLLAIVLWALTAATILALGRAPGPT